MARASWKRTRDIRPSHRCRICEGRAPQAVKESLRCPIVEIYDHAEADVIASLKRKGLWRGRAWYEGLVAEYSRIKGALQMRDNRVSKKWPVAMAMLAETILGAQAAVDFEEQQA